MGASLLGDLLIGKIKGKGINGAGEGVLRAGYEIQEYYKNKPRFNGVYSRDNLPKIKDGAYIINLDEYSDIGTYWVTLYAQNNVTYFDSFGVEHIPKEISIYY